MCSQEPSAGPGAGHGLADGRRPRNTQGEALV